MRNQERPPGREVATREWVLRPASKGNRRRSPRDRLGTCFPASLKNKGDGVGKSGMGLDEGVLMGGVRAAFN